MPAHDFDPTTNDARAHDVTGRTWSYASRTLAAIRLRVGRQPHLLAATVVFLLGLAAILSGFPTRLSSTTLAGALFGAAASFIGAWVSERNRAIAEQRAKARQMEMARNYFSPELARAIRRHVWILDRLVANFSMTSMDKLMPQTEPWEAFRPMRPVLFPSAPMFRELSDEDAVALIDFYDSLQGVAETIDGWTATAVPQEVNSWNMLMQSVCGGLRLAALAVERFCPDRQFDPILPASGTLIQRIAQATDGATRALQAHLERNITN